MKVSLSGPMTGIANFNYPAFNAAAIDLRGRGHEVFNPAEIPIGTSYRECLHICLDWLCTEAQAIALLPGWEHSKGARSELHTALALDLKVIHLGKETEDSEAA